MMNTKMTGMPGMMAKMMSGMMSSMMGDQLDLTMGYGTQSLFVEHSKGYLMYKEGTKKQVKNYLLCCVSEIGRAHV